MRGGTNKGIDVNRMKLLQPTRSRSSQPRTETHVPPIGNAKASNKKEPLVTMSLEEANFAKNIPHAVPFNPAHIPVKALEMRRV